MLDILPVGHSVLYQKAEPVEESMFDSGEIEDLVEKMFYTLATCVACTSVLVTILRNNCVFIHSL